MPSKIEWTQETWNPITGCTKVSEGCKNCYAMREAHRMAGNPNLKIRAAYEGLTRATENNGPQWTGKVRCLPDRLDKPLKKRKPAVYFVNSMSDWAHKDVPDEFRDQMLAVVALCPQHQFVFLTKRPELAVEYLESRPRDSMKPERAVILTEGGEGDLHYAVLWPLPNVWIGVSVSNQADMDAAGPIIMRIAALGWKVWISYEPALGPVEWRSELREVWRCLGCGFMATTGQPFFRRNATPGTPPVCPECGSAKIRPEPSPIQCIVTGGESGPKARPSHPDYFRQTRDAGAEAGVSHFHKQNGEWFDRAQWEHNPELVFPDESDVYNCPLMEGTHQFADGTVMHRVGKKAAGRELDGKKSKLEALPWYRALSSQPGVDNSEVG